MLEEIPRVDLSDPAAPRIVGQAFREIGFVFIKAPELTGLLRECYAEFAKVFALPQEAVKRGYERAEIGHQRGWTPHQTEQAIACRNTGPAGVAQPNEYECWFIGPETVEDETLLKRYPVAYHPNLWPAEAPTFRAPMLRLYDALYDVGRRMLRAVEVDIGYKKGFFDEMLFDSATVMRALHYPPVRPEQVGKVVWGCEHTDINLVTVLPASTRPGLWIQRRDGKWIPGMAPEGYAIGQVGDMLSLLVGGHFLSAKHEVRAPNEATEVGRYSAAMFMHPRSDVWLYPDARWADPAIHQPVEAGAWLHQRLIDIGILKA